MSYVIIKNGAPIEFADRGQQRMIFGLCSKGPEIRFILPARKMQIPAVIFSLIQPALDKPVLLAEKTFNIFVQ